MVSIFEINSSQNKGESIERMKRWRRWEEERKRFLQNSFKQTGRGEFSFWVGDEEVQEVRLQTIDSPHIAQIGVFVPNDGPGYMRKLTEKEMWKVVEIIEVAVERGEFNKDTVVSVFSLLEASLEDLDKYPEKKQWFWQTAKTIAER